MELIRLTHENLEKEHICCAISNNKDMQVMSKKQEMLHGIHPSGIRLGAGGCGGKTIPDRKRLAFRQEAMESISFVPQEIGA